MGRKGNVMMARLIVSTASILAMVLAIYTTEALPPAQAQTPPSASERAAYTGLLGVTATKAHNEMRQLVVNGLALEQRDSALRTPFLVAAYNADRTAMEILANAGADSRAKDDRNYDAITILAVANEPAALKTAIALGGDIKAITSPYQGSALIAAAHLGHHEVVRILIEAGATLDLVNNLGWTALIESIVLGDGGDNHQRSLQHLLNAGANPNLADRNGTSPLALAKARGFTKMVEMLTAKSAR
jgi:uncharacterized protein